MHGVHAAAGRSPRAGRTDRIAAVAAFPDHFALVRTIEAEAAHIPPPILRAWTAAGPQTGHLRLAPYLRRIADQGLLDIDDADRAAAHLTLLTITDINQQTFYGAVPLPQQEVTATIVSGVRAFLRSYTAPSPSDSLPSPTRTAGTTAPSR